ncbi:ATP-dependent rRNA helicase RRP3 [Grifola frondosa]|uniref:ATP-dependent rRNA helicase RRP3 n=1 Tax=Grifola frondosa TaxID=5627 RepID=A0A1C7MHS7_GRIFR|nr:ATP-dependent rRNA helicase RRP3 [Grifola frondosa]
MENKGLLVTGFVGRRRVRWHLLLIPLFSFAFTLSVAYYFVFQMIEQLRLRSAAKPDFSHLATIAHMSHPLQPGASAGFFANLSGSHWHLSERPFLLIVSPQTTRAKLLPIPSASEISYAAWPEHENPFAIALSAIPNFEGGTIFVDGSMRTFVTDGLQKAAAQVQVLSAPVEVRRLRERKSKEELEILKARQQVTVLAIRAVRKHMHIGIRESEARQLILGALTAAGLKDADAITLFGENAALPHGSGTDRILGEHDFVLIDCGGSLRGYHSDVTRAFALPSSKIPHKHQALWHIVHSAQACAISTARNGTVTEAVDDAARKIIAKEGYAEYFTHRLGHGIGLEVHESPYLRGGSDDVILTGHTFSDEPGIYIEGKVGVRLEDCFYVDEDGSPKFLTAGIASEILRSTYSTRHDSESASQATIVLFLLVFAVQKIGCRHLRKLRRPLRPPTFRSLGLIDPLLEALEQLKFTTPTDIQVEALPHALQGRDIIGVASTGSGKTAAFALPILQKLWEEPKGLFACVLAPTPMGVRCATITGGMDRMAQAVTLAKRPHVIVATPGRLNDHLENTKGFSLRSLKFLVMDEADRLLDMDFGPIIDKILKVIPKERTTYLFSATMTTKVAKLQRASLSNPVRVEVSSKYSTVSTLLQYYLFMPLVQKDVHLIYLTNALAQTHLSLRELSTMRSVYLMLRTLGFPAIHCMVNSVRRPFRPLGKFKSGGKKMELWPTDKEEIALLRERVDEASRVAVAEMKEQSGVKGMHGRKRRREEGGKDDQDRDDDVVEAGMPTKRKKGKGRH